MPFSASSSVCTLSSVYRELPPSTTTSPGSRTSASSRTVSRVGSPEGTMTHTARGASSAWTRASRVSTSRFSENLSYPTTWWPARRTRSAMLPPILPSPISPSCTAKSSLAERPSGHRVPEPATPDTFRPRKDHPSPHAARARRGTPTGGGSSASAGQAHRHDQVAVAAAALGRPRGCGALVGRRLVDPGQDGGLQRAGEVHPGGRAVHRRQAGEQERSVEPDG